ncbi:PREDICTED: probable [Prunus dulcis]|uniref:PREDICTED: probable n=1 Tax=Prunus dulcis TaxID=3755 RepID=A0A5E4FCP7_PRUDU|nr:PREDICTED: probable [Prunus dulcis]
MRGNIPNDIGNLSSLMVLDMGYNQLSGSIPTSVGRLGNLQGLDLNDNKLQGYIPYQLCQLDNLAQLMLNGNQFSGSIPSCLGNIAALRIPSLQGEIPTGGPFQNFSAQSFVSNTALCGPARLHVPPCKTSTQKPNYLKYLIPGIISAILLVAGAWILIQQRLPCYLNFFGEDFHAYNF